MYVNKLLYLDDKYENWTICSIVGIFLFEIHTFAKKRMYLNESREYFAYELAYRIRRL